MVRRSIEVFLEEVLAAISTKLDLVMSDVQQAKSNGTPSDHNSHAPGAGSPFLWTAGCVARRKRSTKMPEQKRLHRFHGS
ncbi:hypothetical protein CLAIMM_08150 [Cladophialophora immunda]|nr:hypothetical protein CLAIMM_08150 [Cladophialophora immunda]